MKEVKEILTTSAGTEGSFLIPKKIHAVLIPAVEKKRIGRRHAAMVIGKGQIPGSSYDFNLETEDTMTIRKVAEGAEIPLDVVGYTSFNVKPEKYGVRPYITKEMTEDSQFDLLAQNIKRAGVEMAENEDSLILTQALDNASNTVAGGTAITIANFTRAMQYLEDADYQPTTAYVGPEVINDLRNIDTFVEADKLGTREMFQTGFVGRIFGVDVYMISGNIMTTTSTYLFDKEHAFILVEKRPITVERWSDVINETSGAVITQRIKARQLKADAIAKITTS